MANEILCPVCGQADRVGKVSTIYLTGMGVKKPDPVQFGLPEHLFPSGAAMHAVSQKMTPPSSGKRAPTRPIHPDMAVLVFSAIAPIFLYGIYTSQPGMLLPVLGLLACFYALYIWRRPVLIARFNAEQAARNSANQRIQRGIDRWMRLYYCAREDGVFEPGSTELTPLDQMMGVLLREK